jgi:phosphate transport system permease protein
MSTNPLQSAPPARESGASVASQSRRVRFNRAQRYAMNKIVMGLAILSTALVIAPLIAILCYLLYKGASSLNLAFFSHIPAPVGEPGGGMANAIVGSGIVLAVASAIGIPIGIAAGVYLAEFGRGKLLASAVRFTADVLNGVPSIVMGIAAWVVLVRGRGFSATAGGIALAIMMIPTITRTTEEMLATVPNAIREAAYGLGVPRWRTVLSVTLKTASPGIITGCMLAFARVAGETAPLIFTAFGNQFWSFNLTEPIAALPLQIYVYAISPYDEWHRLAWAGSLVLIAMIMAAVTLVRIYASRGVLKGAS